MIKLAQKLINEKHLEIQEYRELLELRDEEVTALIRQAAVEERKRIYGNKVFVRGLVEITNFCKNDCSYCGIRRSNALNSSVWRLHRYSYGWLVPVQW